MSAKNANGADPENVALLKEIASEVAAIGGRQLQESEAEAFARALGLDALSLKRRFAEDAFSVWAEALDLMARHKSLDGPDVL